MQLLQLWDRMICVLYPPRCVLCGSVTGYEDNFCAGCSCEEQPLVLPAKNPLAGVVSPFRYEGGAEHAVRTLKQYRDRRTVQFFAGSMHRMVRDQWGGAFDVVVPVPASRRSLRLRGYNQAAELAAALATRIGVPCVTGALGRSSRSREQHTLTAAERRENAAKSYTLRQPGPLRGKRVLLVDDVYTTGATLEACAALLAGAGATVYAVTATYAPGPSRQGWGRGADRGPVPGARTRDR